ncbi:MAG: endopeptidase La [candidate division Zixibacteria bacterium]|nr:endopeptidase La [candidate division Zixibacteria bacterium]MDH3936962.1 endopeptidase La [candidate division Zixibacteria bacterium]MDH4034496.1 endopeptidase La [candidate division Zixibacteria bacterium]
MISVVDKPEKEATDTQVLSILPLRGTVVYPYLVVPLMIQDADQTRMLDETLMRGARIGLFLQKDLEQENPGPDDLHNVGTAGNILKMLRFPDGSVRFLIQGLSRIKIKKFVSSEPHLMAKVEELDEIVDQPVKTEALQRNLLEHIKSLTELAPYLTEEFHVSAINQDTPSKLTDFVASSLNIPLAEKQRLLCQLNVFRRMERLYQALNKELEVLALSRKIQAQAANELGKSQRDYILREQLKAIKKELGDGDDKSDVDEFEIKIASAGMPDHAEQVARKELDRLSHMAPSSAEYTVSRTYIDWLVTLPWSSSTDDKLDLKEAKKVLDEDHHDLEKVKDRILEHLAVRKLKSDVKGPILCFVGPPGVGKTSLGKSIARSMGRKFGRVSLGGMRDEAEIRGHRRTYIGAMPGRVIQLIKRCGSNNPVIMLDEVDKLGSDFRGDPSSALLEVLDPEQNDSFSDHYLELPFDLSKIMFITTANWLDPIPAVLRDRMEIIRLPGYTDIEKLAISRIHLIPKQLDNHGLSPLQLSISDKAVQAIIDGYTREAGLRNLEREIAAVSRKVARRVASGYKKKITVDDKAIGKLLGPKRFIREALARQGKIGVVPGLAYTAVGGELLFVEATSMPGKREMTLTGHLGDVMKESAHAALSFLRSNAAMFNIADELFNTREIHIHVPSGATPKDGPSAGIAMLVAVASLFTNRAVKPCLAMTGEITLRGQLLPIGGLKEKLLAAYRAGVETVLLPEENRKDSSELPPEIKKAVKLKFFAEALPAVKFALESATTKDSTPAARRKKKSRP